jgi:hypothetical protein
MCAEWRDEVNVLSDCMRVLGELTSPWTFLHGEV